MPETKNCIACAESIKSAARLCKHCGTMQDDEKFVKTTKTKRPRPSSPTKANCLSCEKPLGIKETSSLCKSCQFQVSKHERDLIALGMDIERCPVCKTRFYAPEISSDCHVCEGRNDLSRRLLTSWWVQLIFVGLAVLFSGGQLFASFGLLLLVLGGQALGGNGLLSIIFGLVYLAHGKRHENAPKIKNWLQSTFMFFGIGLVLLFTGARLLAP
jgi:hypothetical protein